MTSKERKQVFDKYTRDRVDQERKEKQNKTKMQREEFRDFLKNKFKENNYSTRLTYAEFSKKHSNSELFKLIEKLRDREQLYNEFIDELKKKEREDKLKEKDKAKDNFLELLKENQRLFSRHSRFNELRERFRDDSRYKALATAQKEDLFRSFISNLSTSVSKRNRSHSRERHHHRQSKSSSSKNKSERSSKSKSSTEKSLNDQTKSKLEDSAETNSNGKSDKQDDIELDEGELNPSSAESTNDDFKLEKDRAESVNKEESNENLTEEERKELEKKRRVERSLKEREKQVKKEMEAHLQEREKHQNIFKKQELVENFKMLLIDLIKNPEMSFRESKKILKKDKRYDNFDHLSREDKSSLFEEHVNNLIKKKRKMFIELLEETKEIKLNSDFRSIKKIIKNDPRYLQFPERRCQKEFEQFVRDKLVKAKNDFKSLLKETKIITHKSRKLIQSTDQQHLADIISHLQTDKRYLDLDLLEDERRCLIIDYIEDLALKGERH